MKFFLFILGMLVIGDPNLIIGITLVVWSENIKIKEIGNLDDKP